MSFAKPVLLSEMDALSALRQQQSTTRGILQEARTIYEVIT